MSLNQTTQFCLPASVNGVIDDDEDCSDVNDEGGAPWKLKFVGTPNLLFYHDFPDNPLGIMTKN